MNFDDLQSEQTYKPMQVYGQSKLANILFDKFGFKTLFIVSSIKPLFDPYNKKKLIFVYNAKGGKWNYILDTAHKYASPSTYDCNLCQITHDLKMRKPWKDYVDRSPHELIFLHLEEFLLPKKPRCADKDRKSVV